MLRLRPNFPYPANLEVIRELPKDERLAHDTRRTIRLYDWSRDEAESLEGTVEVVFAVGPEREAVGAVGPTLNNLIQQLRDCGLRYQINILLNNGAQLLHGTIPSSIRAVHAYFSAKPAPLIAARAWADAACSRPFALPAFDRDELVCVLHQPAGAGERGKLRVLHNYLALFRRRLERGTAPQYVLRCDGESQFWQSGTHPLCEPVPGTNGLRPLLQALDAGSVDMAGARTFNCVFTETADGRFEPNLNARKASMHVLTERSHGIAPFKFFTGAGVLCRAAEAYALLEAVVGQYDSVRADDYMEALLAHFTERQCVKEGMTAFRGAVVPSSRVVNRCPPAHQYRAALEQHIRWMVTGQAVLRHYGIPGTYNIGWRDVLEYCQFWKYGSIGNDWVPLLTGHFAMLLGMRRQAESVIGGEAHWPTSRGTSVANEPALTKKLPWTMPLQESRG
ncbi:MAG TPA: hypothetical protein VGZ47_01255 [Gemmataceae bacterium]|jgi:hypothetical protein|nr:hypothetical protein [Gemmataceae bacterium]